MPPDAAAAAAAAVDADMVAAAGAEGLLALSISGLAPSRRSDVGTAFLILSFKINCEQGVTCWHQFHRIMGC